MPQEAKWLLDTGGPDVQVLVRSLLGQSQQMSVYLYSDLVAGSGRRSSHDARAPRQQNQECDTRWIWTRWRGQTIGRGREPSLQITGLLITRRYFIYKRTHLSPRLMYVQNAKADLCLFCAHLHELVQRQRSAQRPVSHVDNPGDSWQKDKVNVTNVSTDKTSWIVSSPLPSAVTV